LLVWGRIGAFFRPILACALCLHLNFQNVGRLDDFCAAEPPKLQKMIVAGDNIFRLGGDSAFEDAVVRGVFRDAFYALLCAGLIRHVL
jgi:hypothetical protein